MPGNNFNGLKDQPAIYRIVIQGVLDTTWSDWFDGMSLNVSYDQGNCTTTLRGVLPDQSALHGLLARIRNLGLILLLVEREGCGK